jgi:hypothetical protein
VLERFHHTLYVAVREQAGPEASPTVAIIDSQTARGAQKGGLGSILQATTRARRSKVANGTYWWRRGRERHECFVGTLLWRLAAIAVEGNAAEMERPWAPQLSHRAERGKTMSPQAGNSESIAEACSTIR